MPQNITLQTDDSLVIAMKEQSTPGTPVNGSGAEKLRLAASPGLSLARQTIEASEVRDDGLRTQDGLGSRQCNGSFNSFAAIGAHDNIDQAVMRSTWTAAADIDQDDMESATISVSSDVVTASTGSFLTAGLRVGHVVRPSTGFASADQGVNCLVTAVTATTATIKRFDGTALTDVSGPVSTWVIGVQRNIIQGQTDYAYTIEQNYPTRDFSLLADFFRFGSMSFAATPNSEVTRAFSGVGVNLSTASGASAPNFTSPTTTTSKALQSARAKLFIGSAGVVGLSSFDFSLNLNPYLPDTVENIKTEVGYDNAQVQFTFTALQDDLSRYADFLAESTVSLTVILEEPDTSASKDFMAINLPNCIYGDVNFSGLGRARFSSQPHTVLVGADDRGGAYDKTMVRLSTSAA